MSVRTRFTHRQLDAMRFLSLVTAAMRTARRTLPTPLDFEYAFRHEGLTARLLEPHLKPPVTPPTIRREANQVAAEVHVYQPSSKLIGDDLSGDSEKRSRAYIPKQFPSFPSKHTYKFTEVKTERETDPRKIREKATEEARHGEEALRRLVKVGKDHAGVHHDGNTLTGRHLRDQLWEDALRDLTLSAVQSKVSATKDGDEEQSVFVNAAKRYGRKSAVRSRKV
jgi:transcription initiation factor TFIID subunit 8